MAVVGLKACTLVKRVARIRGGTGTEWIPSGLSVLHTMKQERSRMHKMNIAEGLKLANGIL